MNDETWIVDLNDVDNEIWNSDMECNSREEAITEGTKLAKEEGLDSFRIGLQEDVGNPCICVNYILEQANIDMYEEVGEVAEDYLRYISDKDKDLLENKLNEVFHEWLKTTNNESNFYKVLNDERISVEEGEK